MRRRRRRKTIVSTVISPFMILFLPFPPSTLPPQDTRSVVVHQLLVKVAGWQKIDIPVSVDKIGVFFREVSPSFDTEHDSLPHLPPDRTSKWLVFAISLSDTQKVVNIRSSLVLHNTMELPLDIKLENPNTDQPPPSPSSSSPSNGESIVLPPLAAKGYAAVPLHLTAWNIRVKPQGWGTQYCSKQLVWRQAMGKTATSHVRACEAIGERDEAPFR